MFTGGHGSQFWACKSVPCGDDECPNAQVILNDAAPLWWSMRRRLRVLQMSGQKRRKSVAASRNEWNEFNERV